jgi:hypothetical protein
VASSRKPSERALFEQWIVKEGWFAAAEAPGSRAKDGGYRHREIDIMWAAWRGRAVLRTNHALP